MLQRANIYADSCRVMHDQCFLSLLVDVLDSLREFLIGTFHAWPGGRELSRDH
jgi:hypothetical protein